jgi:hypothetical protein
MRLPIGIVAMAALVTACGKGTSDVPVVRLASYTAAEQAEAAAALPAAAPILRRMVEDYGQLRAEIRAAAR